MSYKPFLINLQNKVCFVVGGGRAAYETAESLLTDGALVTVWSEDIHDHFQGLKKAFVKQLNLLQATFTPQVAEHYCRAERRPFLIVAALPDPKANLELAEICLASGVLCCQAELAESEVLLPERHQTGLLDFAVTAHGMAPLAAALRDRLSKQYGQIWQDAARRYAEFCRLPELQEMDLSERRHRLNRLAETVVRQDGDFAEALKEVEEYYSKIAKQDDLLLELAGDRTWMD